MLVNMPVIMILGQATMGAVGIVVTKDLTAKIIFILCGTVLKNFKTELKAPFLNFVLGA